MAGIESGVGVKTSGRSTMQGVGKSCSVRNVVAPLFEQLFNGGADNRCQWERIRGGAFRGGWRTPLRNMGGDTPMGLFWACEYASAKFRG